MLKVVTLPGICAYAQSVVASLLARTGPIFFAKSQNKKARNKSVLFILVTLPGIGPGIEP